MSTNTTTVTTPKANKAQLEAQLAAMQAQLEGMASMQAQLTALAEANAKLQTELASAKAKEAAPKAERTTLPTWRGHSATALVRSLAKMGAAPGTINRVLVGMGIIASPATISTQRQEARKGKEGAKLTPEQEVELRKLMAGIPATTPYAG